MKYVRATSRQIIREQKLKEIIRMAERRLSDVDAKVVMDAHKTLLENNLKLKKLNDEIFGI